MSAPDVPARGTVRPGSWSVDSFHDGPGGPLLEVAIWPLSDLVAHELPGQDCVCGPVLEVTSSPVGPDVWTVTHQALDGRA